MVSDIKLNGNGVLVEGSDVTFDRGAEQSSVALNLKNPSGFWHISGPRSYESANPLSIYWHDNSKFNGPYLTVNNLGNVIIGTSTPSRTFRFQVNGNVRFADATNYLFVEGKVGIGIENPTRARLQVGSVGSNTLAIFGQDAKYNDGEVIVPGEQGISLIKNAPAVAFNAWHMVTGNQGWTSMAPGWTGWITLNQSNGNFQVISGQKATTPDAKLPEKILLAVTPNGDVQVTGKLTASTITQTSSIALKENVAELSGQEAMVALQGLSAVKYNYKADNQKEQHVGFIAEEVPDLVATAGRDRLSPMDLIAVLTKAVQEQQRTITELASEMHTLKQQNGGQ